jgi:cell division protein FtsI/penicillin-binding protein 2
LSDEEKNNFFYNTMWNNKCVQNTYEPGSTFKIITSAAALEEGLVKKILQEILLVWVLKKFWFNNKLLETF